MDRSQLLQHFETLAETPDAVAKLRTFVSDLAIRGSLLPQNRADEPASSLLTKIRQQKQKGKSGATRNEITDLDQTEQGKPFAVPAGWEWAHLSSVALRIHYGYTASAIHGDTGVRLLRITDIQGGQVNWDTVPGCQISDEEITKYELRENDLLIARTGGTIGKSFLVRGVPVRAVFASYLIRVIPSDLFCADYLSVFLSSSFYWDQLRDNSAGTGQPNVNGEALSQLLLPVPPLAEQRRIVAKVEELLALCDELEARQTAAREHRTRLVRSALDHLTTAKDEPEFRKHSAFFVKEFSHISDTVDLIPLLRAGMIEIAVAGALTGGASAWEQVQLRKVANSRLGKMLDKAKNKGKPLPYLRNTNVQWFRFELSDVKEMLFEDDELDEFSLRKGDLLVCEGGEPGRCAVWDGRLPKMVFQKAIHRVRPNNKLLSEFLAYRLRADATSGRLEKHFTGATIKHFTGQELARYTFPLPPLAEQQRIVAKVEELMRWCDALEARLTAAQTTATHLLDSLLHHTLAPAA